MKKRIKDQILLPILLTSIVVAGFLAYRVVKDRNDRKNNFGDPILDVVDPPNPPPECSVEYAGRTQQEIKFQIQDTGGIYKINVLRSDNSKVDIPKFNTDIDDLSPKSIFVTAEKINRSKVSHVTLEVLDMSLGMAVCDSSDF